MTKGFAILLFLLPVLCVEAQSIRLSKYRAPTALYLDADRLYNFNRYERSRFELGLTWVVPNISCPDAKYFLGQWTFKGYCAYGVGDRDLKWGGSVMLRLPTPHDVRLRLQVFDDLERAASRSLSDYRMLAPSLNTGFVSSRFVGVRGAVLSLTASPSRQCSYTLAFRQSWEDYRFDAQGFFYPAEMPSRHAPASPFTELSARLRSAHGMVADLRAGRMGGASPTHYLRGLLQYQSPLGSTGLSIFAQAGATTDGAPYSRLFDLSGTSVTPYFFKNTFLTVAPNSLSSNIFAHFCLHYVTPQPLWRCFWSAPHPFLQFNAQWGFLWGQDGDGRRQIDGIPLQSPYQGLFEPCAGINGLVHWGLLDIGVAAAYRLCPPTASYHSGSGMQNFAIAVVADFVLDRYNLIQQ